MTATCDARDAQRDAFLPTVLHMARFADLFDPHRPGPRATVTAMRSTILVRPEGQTLLEDPDRSVATWKEV
jgi:hypothetical protein